MFPKCTNLTTRGVDPWFTDALGALGRFHRALVAALGAPGESETAEILMGRWEQLRKISRDGQQLRDKDVQNYIFSISALLEEYRSDPAGSVQQLQQALDEATQLRTALRLARESVLDNRRTASS